MPDVNRPTLEQLVARVNAGAYLPPPEPTAVIRRIGQNRKEGSKMAHKVKLPKGREFQFKTATAQSKYPWDEWFSGDLLLLERSTGKEDEKGTVTEVSEKKDYEVQTDAMPPKIKTAARRRYKVCQISRVDHEGNKLVDSLIIRARDMTLEERQEEDELRAEEKAEREAKKKTGSGASANGDQNDGEPDA